MARFLHEAGRRIIAVADSRGATYNEKGLDIPRLTGRVQQVYCCCNCSMTEQQQSIHHCTLLHMDPMFSSKGLDKVMARGLGCLLGVGFLHEAGGRIMAVADSRGATYSEMGLDIPRLTGTAICLVFCLEVQGLVQQFSSASPWLIAGVRHTTKRGRTSLD